MMRSVLAAAALSALAACSGQGPSEESATPAQIPAQKTTGPSVGVILPLSGPRAAIGGRLRDAIRLALSAPGSPTLDIRDSALPGGVQQATRKAVQRKDIALLGPLTSGDTALVADIARGAGVPVLAFTSDSQQAQPGVWVMGLTPQQQVDRLVKGAVTEGRTKFAAFLPDSGLGHAMGDGLVVACQEAGVPPPRIIFHTRDPQQIHDDLKTLSDIAARRPAQSSPPPAAAEPSAVDPAPDIAAAPSAENSAQSRVAPPPFDALLLADTGLQLAQVIKELQDDQIGADTVRIMGPTLWRAFDSKLGALAGAWYASPDDRQRGAYVSHYRAVYHQDPSPVTDFAYDSAALIRTLSRQNTLTMQDLTRPNGFSGVGGVFRLRPDGRVMRSLLIFQIQPNGGAQMVTPVARSGAASAPVAPKSDAPSSAAATQGIALPG